MLAGMTQADIPMSWNGYEHTNRYKVIRLIEIEGLAILERQAPGLLPFTPLMKPPTDMDSDRWVQDVY